VREFLQRHRRALIIFSSLVAPLFLLYVHGRVGEGGRPRRTTVIEYALLRVTGPAQEAASRLISGLASVWDRYVALVDAQEDNAALRAKVRRLTADALLAKQLREENERLRALLEFKRARKDLKLVGAQVIGKDVSPYARVVRIALDVGAEDGVKEGMAVVTERGLVGRILRVGARYAEVMLAVDARSSVSVKVAGKGITGTLQGGGARDSYAARLLLLHRAAPIALNDTIVTSGHDRVFPPNIEVGYVSSLEVRQRGNYFELEVAPAVNFSVLEHVQVVVGTRAEWAPKGGGASSSPDPHGASGGGGR